MSGLVEGLTDGLTDGPTDSLTDKPIPIAGLKPAKKKKARKGEKTYHKTSKTAKYGNSLSPETDIR